MGKLWQNFLVNIKREKLLAVSNLVIMTVTFLVLGMFLNIVTLSQTALRSLEEQAQLTVFFKDEFLEDQILNMKLELEKDERIMEIKYVSKEDAYRIFTEINKDQPVLLESISKNILPASLEIKTKELSDLSGLVSELEGGEGVEEVKFYKDVIDRFISWSSAVYVIGLVLAILFVVVSYSVVVVTIRLTISSKGSELEVLKLVGASDKYVKAPLVFQGTLFGFISAFVSSVLLSLLSWGGVSSGILPSKVAFFFISGAKLETVVYIIVLVLVLLLSGILLGFVGSSVAVKKYLKY
ncbi:hypothetical protein A3F07_02075 [candidate division WWE3 bacterium RIFCSPHIGHO2_12_FULL_38_15]|uniref:Cell division protein FtsX n=1 Tax=candidate division WWE3 bacterium RIFCSPHIGHO2_02_FULL_38_14 TaxID=1802620 RepID=A0A1F4V8E2_UNCKA|nr:MAG: hypothetical protein A2793_03310 [candidate division WWE3 bacterium RIFCSPHIGHO2_01_FULL_38_45]OGC48668.1 MAG: hypothetical protein A3F07_02075 [candidate division WWE3 bacterium RIFCSPHIGHO2_12_FULL_38_15]OGC53074.1 MAG: hypothetical protein A3B64_01335 [candidate division WWE3 bacterium RIFCSPLOWO2_01_FULL_37_24]OGC53437.1 MAG: hypothetical protein A3D91_00190 [candidate division WWE3 bacterium RIFCSPHIGHO2_02_FULL_38_14]HLB51911.1 permease-like cell division protein FtsX [Patescibact